MQDQKSVHRPDIGGTLKIKRATLNTNGTCGKPPANSSGGLKNAGEAPLEGLGGMEPDERRGGLLINVN